MQNKPDTPEPKPETEPPKETLWDIFRKKVVPVTVFSRVVWRFFTDTFS